MSETNTEFLEAIPYIGALVDGEGDIVHVNRAWREFGRRNGLDPAYDAVGKNYLEKTREADEPSSQHIAEKFSALLRGESSGFTAEYPCHGPEEPRWYRVHANPVEEATDRLVTVLHENVTEERVTQLIPNSAWEPLLADLRERPETTQTAESPLDAELFETELGTVLRTAYDNGITVEGVYTARNESPYPDWEVIIDQVTKPSDDGGE